MPHEHHDHPHSLLPPEPELRVKALETILVEKGLVDPEALQLIIDTYQHKIGPQIGAQLVARAWICVLYTSPSPRDYAASRMPSSA